MALLPATVSFPEPGTYCRYWDTTEKRYKFFRLVRREYPLVYPRRLATTAPGAKSAMQQFREIRPSKASKHRYMAYIGVRPGAQYYVSYPSTDQLVRWDESITEIDRDATGWISYEESPYDAPTFFIWLEPDTILGVEAINVSDRSLNPEVHIIAAKYEILEESDLGADVLVRLRSEEIESIQINFGGKF